MQLFSSALFALVAVSSSMSSTSGAVAKEYPTCTTQQTTQYFSALSNDLTQCQQSSTYDFMSGSFPTTTQRKAVCECTGLIKQMQYIRVPRCKLPLDGNAYKFKGAIESIFADCSGVSVQEEQLPASQMGSGSMDKGETASADADATTKPSPTPIPTPTVATNSTGSSSDASGANDTTIATIAPAPKTTQETQQTEVPEAATTTAPAASTTAAPPKASSATSAAPVTMAVVAVTTSALVLLA